MSLAFRTAGPDDRQAVCDFYDHVIDMMQGERYSPRWTKGVYPSQADLCRHIDAGHMVVGELDGTIAAAAALDDEPLEDYAKVPWLVGDGDGRVFVVHLLCTDPALRGRGIARALIGELIAQARSLDGRSIHLDVVAGNLPAEKLYESCGFTRIAEMPLYYEDTGTIDFVLYELPL